MERPERLVWLTAGAALIAAGQLLAWPLSQPLLVALAVFELFAHASAVVRLRALIKATKQ